MNTTKNTLLSVGYKKWVLWVMVVLDICLIPILAILPFVDVEGMTFIWRVIFALPPIWFSGHLTVVIREIYRNGVALSVGREGVLLYPVSGRVIPWNKMRAVTVHNISFADPRRYIEIECTVKASEFPSPYLLINLHRFLTLGYLRKKIHMDLSGADTKNVEIRRAIRSIGKRNIIE